MIMSGLFVLRMDKILPRCVAGFEVNWDIIFIEDPQSF